MWPCLYSAGERTSSSRAQAQIGMLQNSPSATAPSVVKNVWLPSSVERHCAQRWSSLSRTASTVFPLNVFTCAWSCCSASNGGISSPSLITAQRSFSSIVSASAAASRCDASAARTAASAGPVRLVCGRVTSSRRWRPLRLPRSAVRDR
eukprot:6197385-Pleurochrysis_carterae.AAC.1